MSKIFGRAGQVVPWLGPAYDNSDFAMAYLSGLWPHGSDWRYHFHEWLLHFHELLEASRSICERPYWKRLWVFQELKHARYISVVCGEETVPWDRFKRIQDVIADKPRTSKADLNFFERTLAMRMITLRTKPTDSSLWNSLRMTIDLDCADPRDGVYALLSVVTKGHENMEADCSASGQSLGRHVLRNKYALRPPISKLRIAIDCKFLEGILKLSTGDLSQWIVRSENQ